MRKRRSHRWFIAATVNELWNRFRQGCRAIPAEGWRQWISVIGVGFGVTAIATAVVTRLGQVLSGRGLQAWDEQLLKWTIEHSPMSFAQGITWQSPGNLVGMLPTVLVAVAIASWFSRSPAAVSLVSGYVLQFAFAWIGWGFWNRDRPDLVANGMAAPGLHSFPSGHSLVVMTVHGLLVYLWLRSSRSRIEQAMAIALFLIWITLIGLSRLVLGAHWPSDVIVGYGLGAMWLITLAVAIERAEAVSRR